ncbi:hypothetical protein GMA12_11960 [Kocuria sediminis]|uniref:Uncharacterized protein n=1 Tax=Kocuria sediminis TaxID=1038857 RepID=A0A6N8GNU7_9MICC|nr:hypothetical protein [Kocuria sediminis]MUN63842.1 hypothetical protein [Kocuria sediminis]
MTPEAPDRRLDDEVRARHAQALAAGERRVLMRTGEGRLHSYARDEIGIVPAGSGFIVTSAPGMALMTVFFVAVVVFSVALVVGPTSQGQDPLWGALWLTAGALGLALYTGRLTRAEVRARRVRRQRGVPTPSQRTIDF